MKELKLFKEPEIVLQEETQIVDAVLEHCSALDAKSESKSCIALRVDAESFKDVRMDHTCTAEFQPAASLAERAASAFTDEAAYAILYARFYKREEVWAEAHPGVRAEHLACKLSKCTFEVGETDPLVYHKAIDLMECVRVGRIHGVVAEASADGADAERRLPGLHHAPLKSGGLSPHKQIIRYVERHLCVHSRMVFRVVQRIKIVSVLLDFGAVRDLEAHADEDLFDLIHGGRERMSAARAVESAWKGDVYGFGLQFELALFGFD